MITRTLLTTLCLFIIYNLCLLIPAVNQRFVVQSQWQENLVKAQEYLVDRNPRPYVLVGSSLMARFSEESFGPNFYNLALKGGSALTGLELIDRKPEKPAVVFVEINMLLRDADQPVLNNAFRPVFSQLRHYVPALREKFQPANLFAGKIGEKIVAIGAKPLQRVDSTVSSRNSNTNEDPVFLQLLEIERTRCSQLPESTLLELRSNQLKRYIDRLAQNGVRVVLVEMPIDRRLEDLPLTTSIRDRMHALFPPGQFTWVEPDRGRRYVTTDGMHLAGDSLTSFAQKIASSVTASPR